MEIEICALLGYYAAVTIPYRRFDPTYPSHLQGSVLKEGKQYHFLRLNLMEIEICSLLGYYMALTIPYRRFGLIYLPSSTVSAKGRKAIFLVFKSNVD
jgi:hypothetical protein